MSYRKPFDPALYNQFDALARRKTREIFNQTIALTLQEPENRYDVDFNVYRQHTLIGNLELEVKTNWIEVFPFQDIQFLERKLKYTNTLWVLFNRDCSQHLTIPIKRVRECGQRVLINKYSGIDPEVFYVIPLQNVVFNGLHKLIDFEERLQFASG